MTRHVHNPAAVAQAMEILIEDNSEYMTDILERSGADDPQTRPVKAAPLEDGDSSSAIVVHDNHENLYLVSVSATPGGARPPKRTLGG